MDVHLCFGRATQPAPPRDLETGGRDGAGGGCGQRQPGDMALAATRLGLATHVAAEFGNDLFSRLVLDAAAEHGLDAARSTRLDRPRPRLSVAFIRGSERGSLTYSPDPVRQPADASPAPRWLLQTFRHDPNWLVFQRVTRDGGACILLDGNGAGAILSTPGVRAAITGATIFAPNEAEALTLTGESDTARAAATLATLTPTVIVKCGAEGALIATGATQTCLLAPPVTDCNTVGAGDTCNAGLLSGHGEGPDRHGREGAGVNATFSIFGAHCPDSRRRGAGPLPGPTRTSRISGTLM